ITEIGLQTQCHICRRFCIIQTRAASIVTKPIELGVQPRTQRESQHKLRSARDRFIYQTERLYTIFQRITYPAPAKQLASAQKEFVGGKVACRMNSNTRSFVPRGF